MQGISFWQTKAGDTPIPPTNPVEDVTGYMPYGFIGHSSRLYITDKASHCIMEYQVSIINSYNDLVDKRGKVRFGTRNVSGTTPYTLTNPTYISCGISGLAVCHNDNSEIVYYPQYTNGNEKVPGTVVARTTCDRFYGLCLFDVSVTSGQTPGLYALIRNPYISSGSTGGWNDGYAYYLALVRYDLSGSNPENYEIIAPIISGPQKDGHNNPCAPIQPTQANIAYDVDVISNNEIYVSVTYGNLQNVNTNIAVINKSTNSYNIISQNPDDGLSYYRGVIASNINTFNYGTNPRLFLSTAVSNPGWTDLRGYSNNGNIETNVLSGRRSLVFAGNKYSTTSNPILFFIDHVNKSLWMYFRSNGNLNEITTGLIGDPFI